MYGDGSSGTGDRLSQRDVLGADPHAILRVSAIGDTAGLHEGIETLAGVHMGGATRSPRSVAASSGRLGERRAAGCSA